MIKNNKPKLILSSVVILLPILVGMLLWDQLPDRFATHWGISGDADGWSSKTVAIFLPPLSMLVCHWFCILVTAADPRNKDQHRKATGMILWIMPLVSLFSSAAIYSFALGAQFNMASLIIGLVGTLFIGIGNYLPKVKPNFTIGVKVPWALHDEANWNATHRFSGKVWVAGGLALLFLSLLPMELAAVPLVLVMLAMVVLPVLYSWQFYKKHGAPPKTEAQAKEAQNTSAILKGTLIAIAVLFAAVGILLFSGHIDVAYSKDTFTLDASLWQDLTVRYDEIESIEYRNGNVDGSRTRGLGSFRLLLGDFRNDEFGSYTRYTYYDPGACVVLTVNGETLVISGTDAAETAAIYDALTARME